MEVRLPRRFGYLPEGTWLGVPFGWAFMPVMWHERQTTTTKKSVWLSVDGVWHVVHYAHHTELWWTWSVVGEMTPRSEFNSLQLYWACRYGFSKYQMDGSRHGLYWASVREVR